MKDTKITTTKSNNKTNKQLTLGQTQKTITYKITYNKIIITTQTQQIKNANNKIKQTKIKQTNK